MNLEPIFESYKQAMKRDFPREAMPEGALWNLVDYIPEAINSALRKRGGFAYASQDITSVTASATYIAHGIFAPYSAGNSILAFDEDGRAYEVESTTGTENIGAAVTTRNSTFYSDMVVVAHDGGTTAPKKITRSGGAHTIANLGGTPPAGRYLTIYKDVLWLAAPSASADRIFFSTAGNPEATWDTANKYLDSSYPITGLAALSNAVFVFSLGRTMRVRGSIPPPDSDFIVDDPLFEVGCTDNRSIANYRDKVIWANAQGLYISDGTALEDLTRICGMKSWWRDVMAGREGSNPAAYSVSTHTIAAAVYGDYYFFSILNSNGFVDAGFIDLTRYTWHRLSNIDAACWFSRPFPEELFWGMRNLARVVKMSDIFAPTAATKADADGVAVTPVVEFPFWTGGPGQKTFRSLAVGYDIRDAASDNPNLTVSYIDTSEETSYTNLSPSLDETTEYERVRLPLNFPAPGIGLKITQVGASSDTRLYTVELDARPRELARSS